MSDADEKRVIVVYNMACGAFNAGEQASYSRKRAAQLCAIQDKESGEYLCRMAEHKELTGPEKAAEDRDKILAIPEPKKEDTKDAKGKPPKK